MRDSTVRRMRRFYQTVGTTPAEGGFAVTLDGKAMRTPARWPLILPSKALAEAVAVEWDAQEETIEREALPLTRLVCTALDRVAFGREAVIDELVAYAGSDLVCYRAERPPELVRRQAAAWEPLLLWVVERFEVRLEVTAGIAPVAQPPQAVAALWRQVEGLADLPLTALHSAAQAAGSLVIALALAEGRLAPEAAFELSQIDETFQIEQWGEDPVATERRRSLAAQLAACALLFRLST